MLPQRQFLLYGVYCSNESFLNDSTDKVQGFSSTKWNDLIQRPYASSHETKNIADVRLAVLLDIAFGNRRLRYKRDTVGTFTLNLLYIDQLNIDKSTNQQNIRMENVQFPSFLVNCKFFKLYSIFILVETKTCESYN